MLLYFNKNILIKVKAHFNGIIMNMMILHSCSLYIEKSSLEWNYGEMNWGIIPSIICFRDEDEMRADINPLG